MSRSSVNEVQRDRARAAWELSRQWGACHVVLKGHQTVVGRDKEDLFINNSGNPHQAQGGGGDLLAGYLGGLLAQPELQKDAGLALRFGVWQHGAAADSLLATRPNFTMEDLAQELGNVRAGWDCLETSEPWRFLPLPPSDGGEGRGEEAPLFCRTAPLLGPLPIRSSCGEEEVSQF